jgi:hypothetical protein
MILKRFAVISFATTTVSIMILQQNALTSFVVPNYVKAFCCNIIWHHDSQHNDITAKRFNIIRGAK